jgi:hypothetical protein
MLSPVGYPINWGISPSNSTITTHPLFIKYQSTPFGAINAADVKTDLSGVQPSAESAAICAYLSWLLRTLALIA